MRSQTIPLLLALLVLTFSCHSSAKEKIDNDMNTNKNKLESITLGAGCFWCVEAIFQDLKGVVSVESGYTGGKIKNPTYKEVCGGGTGHAEVAQISFDPELISVQTILAVFFKTHDPTTLNRQGADVGTQYRSAIFYHSEEQKTISEDLIKSLNDENAYPNPIVTEISPLSDYYPAENYHQDYFNNNAEQGYCKMVIQPKVDKFKKVFGDYLK